MNTRYIAALAALVSIAASGDIHLLSGNLMLPTRSGAFSGTSTEGYAVEHVYFSLEEEEFGQYENDSAALFEDYLAGGFDNAEFYWKRPVNITDSYSQIYVMEVASDDYIMPEGENVYFAGIFVYIDGATGATNYIARAVTTVAPEDLFENVTISNIAIRAGSWSVLGGIALPSWADGNIAEEDIDKFTKWVDAQTAMYGSTFDPSADSYHEQYLMNVNAGATVTFSIDSITMSSSGSQISVSCTATEGGITKPISLGVGNLASINGYLNIKVGNALDGMRPFATTGHVLYQDGKAIIDIPASAGRFFRAVVNWTKASQELDQ